MSATYQQILKRIFDHEAIIVIIKGFWKTGKTNVGLRIAEDLIYYGIASICGTNIKIKENDTFSYIEDFDTLKKFHYDHPTRPKSKIFILDEAGKIAVRRGAMRKINVEWMKFIPELSKGKMKLIVITQAQFLTDSMFTETEFTRATITTHHSKEYGYSIGIVSELIENATLYINEFPKTTINYSPYQTAEFFLERRIPETHDLMCCKIARMYAVDKLSTVAISNKLGWTRDKVIRYVKIHIRHTFDRLTPDDIDKIKNSEPDTVKDDEIPSHVVAKAMS
jgi:hypothetical protein